VVNIKLQDFERLIQPLFTLETPKAKDLNLGDLKQLFIRERC